MTVRPETGEETPEKLTGELTVDPAAGEQMVTVPAAAVQDEVVPELTVMFSLVLKFAPVLSHALATTKWLPAASDTEAVIVAEVLVATAVLST